MHAGRTGPQRRGVQTGMMMMLVVMVVGTQMGQNVLTMMALEMWVVGIGLGGPLIVHSDECQIFLL